MYLLRSEPQYIAVTSPAGLGTYEGNRNGIATFRAPLPAAQKKQLENMIAEFDRLVQQNGGQGVKAESTKAIDRARDLVAKGISTEIELESGLILEFGTLERRTKVIGFRWGQVDPKEFATDGPSWDDNTDDPTAGDRQDLIMIGHGGIWRPGMTSHETDGRLLDVRTGRCRRIPFHSTMSLPGCFTKDRSRVVVTGVDAANGVMGLYEIDLKTGANRQLGGDLLASGYSLFPSLSPDGKTVAVLHKGASEQRVLAVQICLVDLATGNARPVGQPQDPGPPSWLPDGKCVLILDRKSIDASKPARSTICRMDLEGRLTPLCAGSFPVILADGERILFEDQASRIWKTCDLDGGNVAVYADGMKGCGFPAPHRTGNGC